ncbi:MAG: helix-turn-helix transcriptional regulator [Clostridiales bacterium]|nr:helix-turn-helix transcriptional regulator [Clostridiales bacterium]
MIVGERIKVLREKSGFTQNSLAEKAGISQTHLRRVELGQADITVGHLQLVCDALGISIKDFFNVNNEADELVSVLSTLSPKQKKLLIDFLKSLQ